MARMLAGVFAVLVGVIGGPAAAPAVTWTRVGRIDPQLQDVGDVGLACRTVGMCIAVSGNGVYASARPRTAAAWRRVIRGSFDPTDVSCASPTACVAIDRDPSGDARILVVDDPAAAVAHVWWARAPHFAPPARHLYGNGSGLAQALTCPSSSLCLAATASGALIATRAPANPAVPWTLIPMPGRRLNTLSCPTPSFCVGATTTGRPVVSSNPTGGPRAWRFIRGRLAATGISCPSVRFCAADRSGFIDVTNDPAAGGWHQVHAYSGDPEGIDCSGNAACQTIDPNALGPIACGGPALCLAFTGGLTGPPILESTAPASGPSAWSEPTNTRLGNVDDGTCPTAKLCLAVDVVGNLFVATG